MTLVYVHILLMVFWIGTDVGVFVAGLRFMDPKRTLAERSAVIGLGMVIDRYPRICFVAIVPVGLQIGSSLAIWPLPPRVLVAVWLLSAVWLACVIAGMLLAGSPRALPWRRLEKGFLVAGLLAFSALGLAGWSGHLDIPGWLAGKLVAYGAMCLFALLLDHAFGPVIATFGAIATGGSTPQLESDLRRQMIKTYVWVLAVYAGVLVSGYLGTVKP